MQEAPIIIVVMNTNARSPFLPVDNDERISEICDTLSIGASIENMLLAADSLGLGTLWIANTCFAYNELVSYLNTEDQLVGAVARIRGRKSTAEAAKAVGGDCGVQVVNLCVMK